MRKRQLAGFAGRSCRCQRRGLQICYRRTSGCNLPVLILGSARRRKKKKKKKKGGGGGEGGGIAWDYICSFGGWKFEGSRRDQKIKRS